MEQIVPDGRYWLDCSVEEIEIIVFHGQMFTTRVDGEIIDCGHVNDGIYTVRSFTPRKEGDTSWRRKP